MPGVHFLTLEAQQELGFRVCKLLVPGSFGSRNIGFLYAIEVRDRHTHRRNSFLPPHPPEWDGMGGAAEGSTSGG